MTDQRMMTFDDTEWLYAPDVPYAEHGGVQLRMQLIFPYRREMAAEERYPVMLFLPGAAWYRQEMYNGVPQWAKLAEKGIVFAAVQVRASDEAKFPAQTEDVLAAMRHLAKEAAKWHIDPHRMYLCGQSSGGHIALMSLLTKLEEIGSAPDFTLRGVIAVSAPTDMSLCGGKPSLDLLGVSSFEETPEAVAAASCGTYISREVPLPRFLLIHGIADEVVPIAHSERLHRQLLIARKRVEFLQVSGAGHGGAWQWRDGMLERLMKFVREG